MSGGGSVLHRKRQNGKTLDKPSPPELAHVTNNIVPLSNILRFHTQEAYKQLSRQIESLAHMRTTEPDSVRKKKLLTVIVLLRQDFVKLYALVKWAQRSKDVSKLIDLLNWLRTQEFYFDNLALGLNELNHFSGAKLPQADILTLMEVLVKGRPQLPSYNYIEKSAVSPERILQVLRDLNLVLTARMALIDDMPARFCQNYTVKDGRVIITLAHEFRVSVTVGNDLIVASPDEYYQSPFFFIDFAFLFGVNQDNSLTTHRDLKIVTQLPKASREKLEKLINQVLLKQSLTGLYEVLHKYASAFKLYLISRQLRDLAINSKWRGNIQYKHSSFLVLVNYWSNHYLLRMWKSFIEIGIDRNFDLTFRWFKNGKYDSDHGIASISGNSSGSSDEPQEFNFDFVLSLIINRHSDILINKVYAAYTASVLAETVSFINPHQLLVKLTPRKSTVFAINPLSGHFYFIDPSPIESCIQMKINGTPKLLKSKAFASEADMIANVVVHLVQLRTDNLSTTIKMRLFTMGWVANDIIKLSEAETSKLVACLAGEHVHSHSKSSFFRRRTWPLAWFLINMVSGTSSKAYWWVARLKSIKGEWVVQWVQELLISGCDDMDHAFFTTLVRASSKSIIHHLIVEELHAKNIGFVILDLEAVLGRFNVLPLGAHAGARTVMALHNPGNLLPISASSTTLFLACLFSAEGKANELRITVFGSLRDVSASDARSLLKLGVDVDPERGRFCIESAVDLSTRLTIDEETPAARPMLGLVLDSLARMSLLIKILDQIRSTQMPVITSSFDELSFEIDHYYEPFLLKVQSDGTQTFELSAGRKEKRHVHTLVRLLNRDLNQSGGALLGSFKYLKEAVGVFQTIDSVEEVLKPAAAFTLPNNLRRLHFEPKFLSLNLFQFVFGLNSTLASTPKKIQRDKIVFSVSFKKDRFAKYPKLLLKLSMKENFNSQNIKFKKLLENVFAASNDVQKDALARNETFLKLYYDFVIDSSLLHPLMVCIAATFVDYLKAPQ